MKNVQSWENHFEHQLIRANHPESRLVKDHFKVPNNGASHLKVRVSFFQTHVKVNIFKDRDWCNMSHKGESPLHTFKLLKKLCHTSATVEFKRVSRNHVITPSNNHLPFDKEVLLKKEPSIQYLRMGILETFKLLHKSFSCLNHVDSL